MFTPFLFCLSVTLSLRNTADKNIYPMANSKPVRWSFSKTPGSSPHPWILSWEGQLWEPVSAHFEIVIYHVNNHIIIFSSQQLIWYLLNIKYRDMYTNKLQTQIEKSCVDEIYDHFEVNEKTRFLQPSLSENVLTRGRKETTTFFL